MEPREELVSTDEHGQKGLGLAELVCALSDELQAAHQIAVRRGRATTIWTDATVQVEVEVELTASGGVRFWVANAGGGAKRTRSTTLSVNLKPLGQGGDDEMPI